MASKMKHHQTHKMHASQEPSQYPTYETTPTYGQEHKQYPTYETTPTYGQENNQYPNYEMQASGQKHDEYPTYERVRYVPVVHEQNKAYKRHGQYKNRYPVNQGTQSSYYHNLK